MPKWQTAVLAQFSKENSITIANANQNQALITIINVSAVFIVTPRLALDPWQLNVNAIQMKSL